MLFRIRKQWVLQSPETGPIISSTAEIIEEEYLTSKTVEDEDTILIDTNDTMDLVKIIVNGLSVTL